jgi:branched-subunit amino acid transport protein AzlD
MYCAVQFLNRLSIQATPIIPYITFHQRKKNNAMVATIGHLLCLRALKVAVDISYASIVLGYHKW